jgi:hypothetical protein
MWFLGFSNHEKGAPRQEITKWSTVCSTFLRCGWSIVRSASLAKGGTLKRDHHHTSKVPTWSNKLSPWTLQTVLVYKSFSLQVPFVQHLSCLAPKRPSAVSNAKSNLNPQLFHH